jgi:tetratricopeptide (TPR) repeat protein
MDWITSIFPSEPDYPADILIDDQPVESIIYRNKTKGGPTPADIAMLWAEGVHLTETMEKTLVGILINNIRIAFDLDRVEEGGTLLKAALPNAKDNPTDQVMILIALWKLYQKANPPEARKYHTKAKKLVNQYRDKVDEQTRNTWSKLVKNENAEANPYELRSEAMEMLEKQEFGEAEKIYRQLIRLGFELPGTLCHLARVQLLMQDEEAARKTVSRAWKLRGKALKYVLPRIIFFKILFAMTGNKNPASWMIKLKSSLQDDASYMGWTIKSTVNQYQSRLTPENFQIMMVLSEVVQEFKNKELLDEILESR